MNAGSDDIEATLGRVFRELEPHVGTPRADWEQQLLARLGRGDAAINGPAPISPPSEVRTLRPTPAPKKTGRAIPGAWLAAAAAVVVIAGSLAALATDNSTNYAAIEAPTPTREPLASPAPTSPGTGLSASDTTSAPRPSTSGGGGSGSGGTTGGPSPTAPAPMPAPTPAPTRPPLTAAPPTTFSQPPPSTPAPPQPTTTRPIPCADNGANGAYPAEQAQTHGTVSVQCAAPGYRGTGYLTNWTSQTITFTITAPTAGNYTMRFRYLNAGPPAIRTLTIGSTSAPLEFATTGTQWTSGTWAERTVTRAMAAGTNTLTLSNGTGRIDLDEITSVTP